MAVTTHKPLPQMSDTQQGTCNTILQVFGSIYPLLHFGYCTPTWNVKSDWEIQVTSHQILYLLILNISGYCTKFNRRKMFIIMIKATTKYQQIISLLLPLGSLKKNNQKFNFFHNLRLWAVRLISSYCKRKGTRKAALAEGYMVTRHCSAFSPCTVPLSAVYH